MKSHARQARPSRRRSYRLSEFETIQVLASSFSPSASPHRVTGFPITLFDNGVHHTDGFRSGTQSPGCNRIDPPRRRGGSYLEVTAIIDWVVRQSIFGEERGITVLETALVLIAFVVVSSVLPSHPSPPVSLQMKFAPGRATLFSRLERPVRS